MDYTPSQLINEIFTCKKNLKKKKCIWRSFQHSSVMFSLDWLGVNCSCYNWLARLMPIQLLWLILLAAIKTWATNYVTILPYNVVDIITNTLRKRNNIKCKYPSCSFKLGDEAPGESQMNSEGPGARHQTYEALDCLQNSKPSAFHSHKHLLYT